MKLYRAWTNTGDWGGISEYYCVAETEEEAEEKMGLAPYRQNRRYDVTGPFEMTGDDILRKLGIYGRDAKGIELTYTIKAKEQEG